MSQLLGKVSYQFVSFWIGNQPQEPTELHFKVCAGLCQRAKENDTLTGLGRRIEDVYVGLLHPKAIYIESLMFLIIIMNIFHRVCVLANQLRQLPRLNGCKEM